MNIKALVLVIGMLGVLTACDNNGGKSPARDNGAGTGTKPDNSPQKPDPINTPAKVVEEIKALQLQKPTHIEDEFLNVMDLDVTSGDRAYFSFSYAPGDSGTLFFTLAQARLYMQGCAKSTDRTYQARIFWQQVLDNNKRLILKEFTPNIDSFDFRKGQSYVLTYALMDLKEFSDCKSVTLKFASFRKDYK